MELKPCPFCGATIRIVACDDEENIYIYNDDYEKNPWNGLRYRLYHEITDDPTDNCPIAGHKNEGEMGIWIYDTREEAIDAWNSRTVQKDAKWEKAKYIEAPVYICSECGSREPLPRKFCPECGAMMEKEERS